MTITRSRKIMFDLFGIKIGIEAALALLILLLDLIIFIVTLVKKKKNVSSVYDLIDSCLPFFIKKAEEEFPHGFGDYKKELVEKAVFGLLKDKFNITDFGRYKDYIDKTIELILSTPQKKGEKSDEEI